MFVSVETQISFDRFYDPQKYFSEEIYYYNSEHGGLIIFPKLKFV